MKSSATKILRLAAVFLVTAGTGALAQTSDLDQMKSSMQSMQKNMEQMQTKLDALEQQQAAFSNFTRIQATGQPTEVTPHDSLKTDQEAAQRPGDQTIDPKYLGFFPIPNSPAIIKFNAKPRVDVTSDSRNSGNVDRFVTATIPVKGEAAYGGPEQFNINARGSQLSVDVRAPGVPGNFRFYYNNDFFGSGGGMAYRLKQLYGQYYNVTAGFTYSVFEDPDAWPDTVDFEGPNATIFARRPVVRYQLPLSDEFQANFGIEQPSTELDTGSTADTVTPYSASPDAGMNVRWENPRIGHVQLGGIARSLGSRGPVTGTQDVFGWGLNLATSLNVFDKDSFQGEVTYGHGIFRYFNDDFINNDAAFDANGNLKAIPAFGATGGYTHHWTDDLRSTATYGYVNIDNLATQGAAAYDKTHYASLNLIWQIRKRLSIGVEGLYGKKFTQNGASGDVFRIQMGLVYSLFD